MVLLKKMNVDKSGNVFCPDCGNEMDNLRLKGRELMLMRMTFGLLRSEKYLCYGCLSAEVRLIKNNFKRTKQLKSRVAV